MLSGNLVDKRITSTESMIPLTYFELPPKRSGNARPNTHELAASSEHKLCTLAATCQTQLYCRQTQHAKKTSNQQSSFYRFNNKSKHCFLSTSPGEAPFIPPETKRWTKNASSSDSVIPHH